MNIHIFERKYSPDQISLEKIFEQLIPEMEKRGHPIRVFKNPYGFSITGILKSLAYFRKHAAQVNLITGDIHWAALALPRKRTALVIHDLRGLEVYKGLRRFIYFVWWFYLPLRYVGTVVAISEKTKEDLIKLMPKLASKIKVIPNCLTIPVRQKRTLVFPNVPNILVVGTRENKNIDRILAALEGIECNITILGPLSSVQKESVLTYRLNCTNVVNVSETELANLYSSANILLFPSLFEGFGLPILEGQANDCVVITSNIAPMKDVSGGGALLVNPYSVSDIAKSIRLVIVDKDLQYKLVLKGRKNVEQYSPAEIADRYLRVLRSLS